MEHLETELASRGEEGVSGAPWWRNGYARFLLAQGLSAVGDRASYVIVPFCLLAVGISPAGVAVVLGARAVGYAMVVLYGGVLADRMSRRRLMVFSDVVRFCTQTGMVVLVITRFNELSIFLVLQFGYGVAEALFKPAAAGIVPEIVEQRYLERANGLLGSVANVGMVVGPLLGGFLVGVGMSGAGLAFDAATFLVSALLLIRLSESEKVRAARRGVRADLREGWHSLLRLRWFLVIVIASSLFHLISLSAVFTLGPALADQSLGGAKTWGVLVMAFGLGGITGGLISMKVAPRRPAVAAVVLFAVLSAQPLFLSSGLPIVLIGALQFCAGVSLTVCSTLVATTCQRSVPRDVLSRISAFDELASTSLLPLGYVVVGELSSLVGVSAAMKIAALVSVTICLAALLSGDVWKLKRGQEGESDL